MRKKLETLPLTNVRDSRANETEWQLVLTLAYSMFSILRKSVPTRVTVVIQYVEGTAAAHGADFARVHVPRVSIVHRDGGVE